MNVSLYTAHIYKVLKKATLGTEFACHLDNGATGWKITVFNFPVWKWVTWIFWWKS